MFTDAEFRSILLESQLLREASLQARLRSEQARRDLRKVRSKVHDDARFVRDEERYACPPEDQYEP